MERFWGLNMINTIKRHLRKRKYGYPYVPRQLSIALTNRCNARCTYCGHKDKTLHSDMDIELYKKIIDSMDFIEEVQPQIVGEPLLYPHIIEAVRYAKKTKKDVIIYTNGSIYSEELAKGLFEAGLNKLIFSIDDDNKRGFEIQRVGLDWNNVYNNFLKFKKIRNDGKYKTKLYVRICKNSVNKDRIKRIRSFWLKLADEVAVMNVLDIYKGRERKYEEINISFDCPLLRDSISIDANGQILLCCRDWFGEASSISNVYNVMRANGKVDGRYILDLYNGSQFNNIRERLRKGKNIPAICKECIVELRGVRVE